MGRKYIKKTLYSRTEKGHEDSDSCEAKSTSWTYGYKQVGPIFCQMDPFYFNGGYIINIW
jgi:hypothetical protein